MGRGRLGPPVGVSGASPPGELMRRHYAWLGVERAAYSPPAALQHMRVEHSRADILVSQEFLDRTNVIPIFQKVRRKGVPQRMTTTMLLYIGSAYSTFYGLLEHCF